MIIKTAMFGEIDTDAVKKIVFADGLIGFPGMKEYTLIKDGENDNESQIFWLQSLDDENFALPIVNPFAIFEEYNPVVEDNWFKSLGEHEEEDLLVFLTMTVPEDITKMTVNKKAPIVINANTSRACQIIVEDESCQVKFPVYDILKARQEKAGD